MQFKEAIKKLQESELFVEWKKQHPKSYLSYGFFVIEGSDCKIGYCTENKITSFSIGRKITVEPEEEAFQKEKKTIEAIDLEKVRLDLADAVAIANKLQQEEFSAEIPKKIIAILQTLENVQVWNITFLTHSFNTLNIKIRSDDGMVVEKKLSPLFQFSD